MKTITKRQDLIKALSATSRVVSTRSTLPILQNVYVGAKSKELIIRSTDLEQTIEVVIAAEVQEDGAITVPLRLLADFLQNNTDEVVTISVDDVDILIKSANHQVKLKGISAQEYPTTQQVKADEEITLEAEVINEAITTCLFAAANDDTRPILTGLLFNFSGEKLEVVGTDGYRLALYSSKVTSAAGQYIIPKRTLLELQRVLEGGPVKVGLSQSQVRFSFDKTLIISRIIDGKFPSYQARIPQQHKLNLSGSGTALLHGLKVASLFSRDSSYSTKLEIKGENLEIIATSPQLGESRSTVTVENSLGEAFTISLNAQYLIEVLNAVGGDFSLELTDASSPVVVRFPKKDNYLYLLMPLRNE
ncbi:MAG: DNA polymerase III subunit beta [Patescibacteria group bacterium]